VSPARRTSAVEWTLDGLGPSLRDVTFLVLDLETTGGSPKDAGITEIGAVLARGGEVVGEFQTLVRPDSPIPPFISVLTGITDAMVADAPSLASAMVSLSEFAGWNSQREDLVLVAHNAPFDVGFLKAAHARLDLPWPNPRVLDTARLARAAFSREEVRDCKLGTLAAFVSAQVTPNHRALADARATVDVLHAIIERVGNLGVVSLDDLSTFSGRVSTAQRRKRHMADALPDAAGVYIFRDAQGIPLYIGVSRSLRSRVRTYFTASEQRSRMAEMVGIAASVTPIVCATDLEARIREIRLIAEHRPAYNKRSRNPRSGMWLTVRSTPAGRVLHPSRTARGDAWIGPFRHRDDLQTAADLLNLAGDQACAALSGQAGAIDLVTHAVRQRISSLAAQEHFEQAAVWRDRLLTVLRIIDRSQRAHSVVHLPEIVAAAPTASAGWDLHLIRFGRLCGASTVPAGEDPVPAINALVATGTVPDASSDPMIGLLHEECDLLLGWLQSPDVRLVRLTAAGHEQPHGEPEVSAGWAVPIGSAARPLAALTDALARTAVSGSDLVKPRNSRTQIRPVGLAG
jgi:DNA polymerase III subunit epsilon